MTHKHTPSPISVVCGRQVLKEADQRLVLRDGDVCASHSDVKKQKEKTAVYLHGWRKIPSKCRDTSSSIELMDGNLKKKPDRLVLLTRQPVFCRVLK